MTPEESKAAIIFEDCDEWCKNANHIPFCNACRIGVALEALDKQIPKEINVECLEEDVKFGNATFRKGTTILADCPSCGEWVNKHHKYCCNCGQKLRWKEERSENEGSN